MSRSIVAHVGLAAIVAWIVVGIVHGITIGYVTLLVIGAYYVYCGHRYEASQPEAQTSSPDQRPTTDRAQVQLVDVIVGFLTFVAMMVLSPYFYKFIGMVSAEADPFTRLLLQLVVPLLFAALIMSVGVSARRGGR